MMRSLIAAISCFQLSLASANCPKEIKFKSETYIYEGGTAVTIVDWSGRRLLRPEALTQQDYLGLWRDPDLKPLLDWANCHLGKAGNSADGDVDTVTPPVPGCPKYLRKSLVTWRQVGNPQLNTWEVRNLSNRTLKITIRDDGTNSSPDTLPPGNSTQVGLVGRQVPPYVVRDFSELMSFNSSQQRKSLECDLAIRPR